MTAVDFLREAAASAAEGSEDTALKLEGDVVVIGGGNVAIDVARTSTRLGASKVSMYCLESRDTMPASEEEIAEAQEEDVVINCGWGPKEILTEEGKVTGIVLKKCISVLDEQGRFAPVYDENDTVRISCSHVFLSVGQSILWGDLLKGTKVELGRGNSAVAGCADIPDCGAGYLCGRRCIHWAALCHRCNRRRQRGSNLDPSVCAAPQQPDDWTEPS